MATAKVIGGNLNLRSFESTSADVLDVLEEGTEVTVKTPGKEWTAVKAGEIEGFVMTKFLETIPDKPKKTRKKSAKAAEADE